MKRKRMPMTKKSSKKSFKRGNIVHAKNATRKVPRGGLRL